MKTPIKELFRALDLLKSVAETMTLELGKEQEVLKELENEVKMLSKVIDCHNDGKISWI